MYGLRIPIHSVSFYNSSGCWSKRPPWYGSDEQAELNLYSLTTDYPLVGDTILHDCWFRRKDFPVVQFLCRGDQPVQRIAVDLLARPPFGCRETSGMPMVAYGR